MSVLYSALVWKIKMPNAGRKLVAISLADQASDDGVCWPSIRTLCIRCDMTPESIKEHLRHLEVIGLVTRAPRFAGGRQTSNIYTFMPLEELEGRVAAIKAAGGGEFIPRGGGEKLQGGGGEKTTPQEPSVLIRQNEPSVKGAPSGGTTLTFNDRNPRPVPRSEEQMYELLEAADILTWEGQDGNFYDQMMKVGWTVKGKRVADWMRLYEARIESIHPVTTSETRSPSNSAGH